MNHSIKLFIITLISLLVHHAPGVSAQSLTLEHRDSLTSVVDEYYRLNVKVFRGKGEAADIDEIFNLFSTDFVYVHPKYGGEYSRQDLYNGYVRNMDNGNYNGNVADIKIKNQIVGLNAVVVEKVFMKQTEDVVKVGDLEMTLFEFKDGKISKIFEYW